jgi:hypothetical protein
MLILDLDGAMDDLVEWVDATVPAQKESCAQSSLAFLFDRHNPILKGALRHASVATLEKLVRFAYSYVRLEQDTKHDGVYAADLRDDAENARSLILGALLDHPGPDAFRAVERLANAPECATRAGRFRELARGKAECDTEPLAWNEAEVFAFEQWHAAPVKTGTDLLRRIVSVLQDIQFQLISADVSSRSLLERAVNEEEVKSWLVEQLNFRSRGRFSCYREAQVARANKPDVIVSSTSAQCEVGIEVKQGNKNWTAKQLDKALRQQLAADYLKPSSRRHGMFVITNHGRRAWRHPHSKRMMTFDELMTWLNQIADKLIENDSGAIEVRCFGIDSTLRI